MKASQKRAYKMPVVVDYGTVAELTAAAGAANSDVPEGTPNTAYPPIS